MIIPIRCFTCNKVIAHLWEEYNKRIQEEFIKEDIPENFNKRFIDIDTLKTKNTTLIQKYEIQVNQLKEIAEKEKLYNKNSKMLQIVQSRNSFKRKIISTLIASIFFFLIITIATFVYYKRTLK